MNTSRRYSPEVRERAVRMVRGRDPQGLGRKLSCLWCSQGLATTEPRADQSGKVHGGAPDEKAWIARREAWKGLQNHDT